MPSLRSSLVVLLLKRLGVLYLMPESADWGLLPSDKGEYAFAGAVLGRTYRMSAESGGRVGAPSSGVRGRDRITDTGACEVDLR